MDPDFEHWLMNREGGNCLQVKDLGDGVYAAVKRLMYHWTMIVGLEGDHFSYTDRWCYATEEMAIKAMSEWDGIGDPKGWHRHPNTGRRRENGDPASEYVAW